MSRQNLPHVPRTDEQIVTIANGGYILQDCAGIPQAIILATGSEVELALTAQTALEAKGIKVRVVSMSSCDTFNAQDATYRKQVLPATCLDRVVAVVAAMESLL